MGNISLKNIQDWYNNLPVTGNDSYNGKFGICSLLDKEGQLGESRFMIELIKSREILIKNELGNRSGKTLDVCCGTGNQSVFLAHLKHEVIGLDFSQKCLSIAKDKSQQLNVNVDYIYGDATNLPFDSNSFDTVTSFFAIHFINPGYNNAIAEMVRVLKRMGTLMLEVYNAVTPFKVFGNTSRCLLGTGRRGKDISWEKTNNVRIHLFGSGELLQILQGQGIILDSIYGLWGVASLPSAPFHRNHKTFSDLWSPIACRIDRYLGKYYPFKTKMAIMVIVGHKDARN